LKANAFPSSILNQLTIDGGLTAQLLALVGRCRQINPATVLETTIPVTQVIGSNGDGDGYPYEGANVLDVEYPDQPVDTDTIETGEPGALQLQ
jgi:hypothetical protein